MQQQYYPESYVSQQQNIQPQMQQVPLSQDEMYANIIQEERIKNLISQISPDNQLADIEMRIKGYRREIGTGQWIKIDPNAKEVHPMLVSRFISYLSSILNQNTSLSNLSENQINKIMKLIIEYIVDDLDANSDIYGIGSDYTERTRIGQIILNTVFMVLNRALNGSEARRMWGTLSVAESMMPDQQQKKSGFGEALKFWK